MGAAAILLRVVVVGVAITVSMTACDGSPLPAGQVVFGTSVQAVTTGASVSPETPSIDVTLSEPRL